MDFNIVLIMLLQLLSLEEPWTLIMDDALANSFVAPATDDIKDDDQLSCKFFFATLKLFFSENVIYYINVEPFTMEFKYIAGLSWYKKGTL